MNSVKPVSVQLYSLRNAAQQDFRGMLKRVAEIGYKGVEPAGFYGLKPRKFRKMVNDLGMVVSSNHTDIRSSAQEMVDTAGELGTTFMVGGFGGGEFADEGAIVRTAAVVAERQAAAARAGVTLLLHNHWWEYECLPDGRMKIDLLVERCPGVQFELDIYWAANFGGNSSAAMVARHARRTPLLHIKDGMLERGGKMKAVGQGKVEIAGAIRAADPAVLQWLVMEADEFEGDMFDCVAESYAYLTGQGLAAGNK